MNAGRYRRARFVPSADPGGLARSLALLALAAVVPASAFAASRPEPGDKVRVEHEYEDVEDDGTDVDPWRLSELQWSHRTPLGSVIGRWNHASRFDKDGDQYEIDFYPKLTKNTYGYLNLGRSNDSIFPEWRWGGELFASLPNSWEASVGFRRLQFDSTATETFFKDTDGDGTKELNTRSRRGAKTITIYTGSVGYYYGNWWWSLRPYVSDKDAGTSQSYELTTRYWYGDREDYVELRAGGGESPEANAILVEEVDRLDSWKVRFLVQKEVVRSIVIRGQVGYRFEELTPTRDRERISVGAGIEKQF